MERWVWLWCCVVLAGAGGSSEARAAEEVSVGSCQVRLLERADAGELDGDYGDHLKNPSSKHREAIREGMKVMPPLLCASAQRVAFVDHPDYSNEDGWVRPDEADLVYINGENPFLKIVQTFVHESTHTAELLLQAHRAETGFFESSGELFKENGDEVGPEHWSAAANALAKEVVANNRLGGGFRAEWQRTHRTFQSLQLAGDYVGLAGVDWSQAESQVTKRGFTSHYGSALPGEDAAEFTSWILVAPLYEREWEDYTTPGPAKDHACQAMQAHDEETVPAALSVLFTKVNLLLSTGLITEQDYDRCVGKLKIQGPGKGVFVYQVNEPGAGLKREFTQGLSATIGTHTGLEQQVFLLEAAGQAEYGGIEYPATIELRIPMGTNEDKLERISWPRGIYNIDNLGGRFAFTVPAVGSATFINTGVSPDGASTCTVLVAHASNERLEGSIFLRHAIRPFAPVPVPQTGLPLRFTFKLVK